MTKALERYIGKEVDVYSIRGQSEIHDTGILVSVDDQWLQLRRGSEVLFFSIPRVRLVKLTE